MCSSTQHCRHRPSPGRPGQTGSGHVTPPGSRGGSQGRLPGCVPGVCHRGRSREGSQGGSQGWVQGASQGWVPGAGPRGRTRRKFQRCIVLRATKSGTFQVRTQKQETQALGAGFDASCSFPGNQGGQDQQVRVQSGAEPQERTWGQRTFALRRAFRHRQTLPVSESEDKCTRPWMQSTLIVTQRDWM